VSGIVPFTGGGIVVATVSVAELVVVSKPPESVEDEEPAPKIFFSFPDAKGLGTTGVCCNFHAPVIESSLVSPKTIASSRVAKPESEMPTVSLTTGSFTPASVRFVIASWTPTSSASTIIDGIPLEIALVKMKFGKRLEVLAYFDSAFLYTNVTLKSSLRLNVSVFLAPCLLPAGKMDVLMTLVATVDSAAYET